MGQASTSVGPPIQKEGESRDVEYLGGRVRDSPVKLFAGAGKWEERLCAVKQGKAKGGGFLREDVPRTRKEEMGFYNVAVAETAGSKRSERGMSWERKEGPRSVEKKKRGESPFSVKLKRKKREEAGELWLQNRIVIYSTTSSIDKGRPRRVPYGHGKPRR